MTLYLLYWDNCEYGYEHRSFLLGVYTSERAMKRGRARYEKNLDEITSRCNVDGLFEESIVKANQNLYGGVKT